jgi:hypothetical protein
VITNAGKLTTHIIAQAVRAILFASAMATSIKG